MKHVPQQLVDVPDPQIWGETDEVIQLTQDRISGHTVEQIIDIPSPQTQERVVDAVVDMTVPQLREEMGKVTQFSPQEEMPDCIAEKRMDVLEPQVQEQIVGVIPSERLAQRTGEHIEDEQVPLIQVFRCTAVAFIDEQIADWPVPMTQARLIEVVKSIPERLDKRTGEHLADVPGSLIQARLAEVVASILEHMGLCTEEPTVDVRTASVGARGGPLPHARTACTSEQMVDVPVPQLREHCRRGRGRACGQPAGLAGQP